MLTETEEKKGSNGKSSIRGRSFTKADHVDLAVLVTYIVQRRGQVVLGDVLDVITKDLGCKVQRATLNNVLEACRKRGHLSAGYVGDQRSYSMAKLRFNCAVEVAHVDKLIPTLLDDVAGRCIKAEIEGENKAGKGKEPDRYVRDWATYTVQFELLSPWYGSQPIIGNPAIQQAYDASKFNNTFSTEGRSDDDYPLVFERSWASGGILVHTGCIRGFVMNHLRRGGRSDYDVQHFGFQPIDHVPKEIVIVRHPIQRPRGMSGKPGGEGTGAGIKAYEAIMAGEVITWSFTAPTGPKGRFFTPGQMEQWLRHCLRNPFRSMSPARGTQTGHAKLVSIEHEKWDFDEGDDSAGVDDASDAEEMN